ncbi:ABC transporter substrate-binding protein [Actinomadura nitritigenes]|uniref:Extracellular solute-binding protein n=1 Tax=Actinomadura nitritigenes TaxID=134602 RepID=A0ABS3R570_9ACTN|nr:extracellular solute-binding protein [Actinomadura nitritigenes]MBO2440962.1 extracellular solute-binding protein [Actinomadura nitritigenes]
MAAPRRRIVASVVAFAVTLVLLQGIRWSLAYHPLFHGCGEHRGLTIAADVDVSPDFQRRALVEKWNGLHPNEPATLIEVARSTDTTRSQIAAALESGSCAYDVLLVDVAWLPEYARRGFLAPVRNAWMDGPSDFLPSTMRTGQWKGEQYAVPWFTDAGLLYVRKGTKPPGSFDELLKDGYATQLADYEGLTANALEAIWNSTGELVLSDAVDKVDVRTAQVVLTGLDHLAQGGPALAASRDSMEDGSLKAFASGQATLMRNWPYAFRALTADPRVGNGFDVRPLPSRGYTVLGGWDLAVSARSRHQAEAGELIRFLTRRDSQHTLFVCGGFTPTRSSVFDDRNPCGDEKYSSGELPPADRFAQFAGTLKTALFQARPRPVTPYYAQFSESFRGCVEQVLDAHAVPPRAREPSAATLAKVLTAALKGEHSSC